VELFEEETALQAGLRCSSNNEMRHQKTPTVMLVVECGSGLDDNSNKTMKQLLLKFVSDLQEN
jgi:ABC-type iron transport system FetAB ATPase subunit